MSTTTSSSSSSVALPMTPTLSSSMDSPAIRIKNFEFNESNMIGAGAFAEVFLGRDTLTNKEVAIKRVLKKKIENKVKLSNGLKTEINIMSRNDIGHDHITKLYLSEVCFFLLSLRINQIKHFFSKGNFRLLLSSTRIV